MMRPAPLIAPLSAVAGALLLAGCGASPSTTLLTLDAVAPPAGAVRADYHGPILVVPAVHLPAVIDRAAFVRQVSAGSAKVDDFAQWAAPLGLLARDALVRDLTARLPAGAVLPPGASGGGKGVTTLDVTILSFDANAGGATMQAAYRTLPNGIVRQVVLHDDQPMPDPPATAEGFATLIGQLADHIVAGLPTTG